MMGRILTRVLKAGAVAALVLVTARALRANAARPEHPGELTDPDPRVRAAAASRIGASREPGARVALEAALRDPIDTVRIAVATALCEYGDHAALPALHAALGIEEDAGVRAVLASTIERLAN